MKISNDIRLAIELCLRHGVPFVAYAMPNEKRLRFRSSLGESDCEDCDCFFISTFASRSDDLVKIPFLADEMITLEALLERPTDICREAGPALPAATRREDYEAAVSSVIEKLKARGGKTVISRTICGRIPGIDWVEFAHLYFKELPMTYRFIYFTPRTGAWIVATPELLFSYNKATKTSHTVALAGTRMCAGDTPWDEKNRTEQKIVSDYVERSLTACGLKPEITGPGNSVFGEIEHLCSSFDMFNQPIDSSRCFDIADRLNPTPAVAGYPVDKALAEIAEAERHDRGCYGGYIGIEDGDSFTAVVNLRCLQFKGYDYCLYAGGGIMPDSDVQREWLETEAKSAKARKILDQFSNK